MTAAAILAIGDEVVLGDRPDTNGPWLAGELAARGISVTQRRQVADAQVAIAAAIGQLASDADLVVTCGGLGPTGDDRTRAALAAALRAAMLRQSSSGNAAAASNSTTA